jgi:hypothetical protein
MSMKKIFLIISLFLIFVLNLDYISAYEFPNCPALFPGDSNQDFVVDITDSVFLLNYLFQNGPVSECLEGSELNGDGNVDISDVIYLLNYLFLGGPEPVSMNDNHLGFKLHTEDITQEGIIRTIHPSMREIIKALILTDKTYAHCSIEFNSRVILNKDFDIGEGEISTNDEIFILLEESDFEGKETGFLTFSCFDQFGNEDISKFKVKNGEHYSELKNNKDDKNLEYIPLQINLESTGNSNTACCNVMCANSNGELVGSTCQQTTEIDCHEMVQWEKKRFKNPDEMCDILFDDATIVLDVEWDKTKECDETLDVPKCKGCFVESMHIAYLPEHNFPDTIKIPQKWEYFGDEQTFPILDNDKKKPGHNEGWDIFLPEDSDKIFPAWKFGWIFLVYANLKEGSNPNDCKEGQFISGTNIELKSDNAELISDNEKRTTDYIKGGMYIENNLINKQRLLDLTIPNILLNWNIVNRNYEISRNPLGCFIGSGNLCADDYLHPVKDLKAYKEDGVNPIIVWYDNPGIRTAIKPSTINKNTILKEEVIFNFDADVDPVKSPKYFSIKKTLIDQMFMDVVAIIEDYKSEKRHYCKLSNIRFLNNEEMAIDSKSIRMQSFPPSSCICYKQKWIENNENSLWETISESPCS